MSVDRNGYSPIEGSGSSSSSSRRSIVIAAVCGILVGSLITWPYRRDVLDHRSPFTVQPTTSHKVQYRPFCTSSRKARIIQTSLQAPSNQWASLPCFGQMQAPRFEHNYVSPDAQLRINTTVEETTTSSSQSLFNPILGFGGAFTEASARNYQRLTQAGKQTFVELLFGKSGLGYSMGRVHINSCDFSIQSYNFDDEEDDFELKHFDTGVHHDVESGMMDLALTATSVLRQAWHDELKIVASPWSPPAWMKKPYYGEKVPDDFPHSEHMTGSATPNCLREGTGPDSRYAKSWALYFSKFLTAYANLGLPLWAVTVQNEPEFPAPWEACAYDVPSELDFVTHHLGPRLRKDHPNVKLLVFDHNKDHINTWVQGLVNKSSPAAPFVDGTGYHWYAGGMDRLLDGALGIPNFHRLQDQLEAYHVKDTHLLIGTESCHCPTTGYAGGDIEISWSRAERYVHTILADLMSGSNGWIEWNLLLDGIGGPNHLGNLCETGILSVPHRALDATPDILPLPSFEKDRPFGNVSIGDGRTREELNALGIPAEFLDVGLAVQPIYFYMGHISRYVRPGSTAIPGLVDSSTTSGGKTFMPEGAVVLGGGQNDLARNGIELTLWPCEGSTRQQFKYNLEGNEHIRVDGHDWLGRPTQSCIGRAINTDLGGMTLTDCYPGFGKADTGVFTLVPVVGDPYGRVEIVLRNHPKLSNPCLAVKELGNSGGAYGPRGGAQLGLAICGSPSTKWNFNQITGEISSLYFQETSTESTSSDVCLTTGWPFLQIGAFRTPNGESSIAIVVLNEAKDSANYALVDDGETILRGSIPPRSVQTILLD